MALPTTTAVAATAALALVALHPGPPDTPWLYSWHVTEITDGDTFKVSAPWLPYPLPKTIGVRIKGIDTPEKLPRAKCAREASLAQAAEDFARQEFLSAKEVMVEVAGEDKYFRLLGDLWLDGEPLSHKLLKKGFAVAYDGGTKVNHWCSETKSEGGWVTHVLRQAATNH